VFTKNKKEAAGAVMCNCAYLNAAMEELEPDPEPAPEVDPRVADPLYDGGFRAAASLDIRRQVAVLHKPAGERTDEDLALLAPLVKQVCRQPRRQCDPWRHRTHAQSALLRSYGLLGGGARGARAGGAAGAAGRDVPGRLCCTRARLDEGDTATPHRHALAP
jgi:hypothetical protein